MEMLQSLTSNLYTYPHPITYHDHKRLVCHGHQGHVTTILQLSLIGIAGNRRELVIVL